MHRADSHGGARPAPHAIALHDVSVALPGADRPAPEGATLHIDPGERVLLIGPSGCGATSLTRALNGLLPRTAPARVTGEIRIGGVPVDALDRAELARRIGMVLQDGGGQAILGTVLDDVAFGPENLLVDRSEVLARATRALHRMGLADRANDDPATLSGGQRRRLAIAGALALDAPLLVLDEPAEHLDPGCVVELHAALAELTADRRRTLLLVQRDVDAALDLVGRVIVLDARGRVVLDGAPRTVFGDHAAEVERLGVRVPAATRAGLALREAGVPLGALPTTRAELRRDIATHRTAVTAILAAHRGGSPVPAPTPAPGTPVIELRSVTVRRGGRTVLDGVDLTVDAGEFLGVAGVNGSGKTTLLHLIAGLGRHDGGTVRVLDAQRRPTGRRPHRPGGVGYVLQDPALQLLAGSVAGELDLALAEAGVDRVDRPRRVDRALAELDLAPVRDRHPLLLSAGRQRLLAAAATILGGADLLLLDEPAVGLDPDRLSVLLRMLAERREGGATVVLVSHDLELLAEHTHRTIILAGGRIDGPVPSATLPADRSRLRAAGLRPPALAEALRDCGADAAALAALIRHRERPEPWGARSRS